MADFIEIDHPCVRRMKVPVYVAKPMTAAEFADPKTPVSEYAMGLIAYSWTIADRKED